MLGIGSGDSSLLCDVCWNDSTNSDGPCFESLLDEIEFHEVNHRGGPIPRLFALQGEVYNTCPCTAYPADSQSSGGSTACIPSASTPSGQIEPSAQPSGQPSGQPSCEPSTEGGWIPVYRHPIDNEPELQVRARCVLYLEEPAFLYVVGVCLDTE